MIKALILLTCTAYPVQVDSFSAAFGGTLRRDRAFLLSQHHPAMMRRTAGLGVVKNNTPPSRIRNRKLSTLTICLVPPPTAQYVWELLTQARTQFKDPGLFRWPPHVNLLYPFVDMEIASDTDGLTILNDDIVGRLESAVQRIEPFSVTLDRFGTFGGSKHGVLWVYPSSTNALDRSEPVHCLYESLIHEFPECSISTRGFNPHMTLSHFESLDDAEAARSEIQTWWPSEELQFPVNEIYLLQRKGDGDQFMRVLSLGLGKSSKVMVHDPHVPFPGMPSTEEEWVRSERLKLKRRRNGTTRPR